MYDYQRLSGAPYTGVDTANTPNLVPLSNFAVGVYMNGAGVSEWLMDTMGTKYGQIASESYRFRLFDGQRRQVFSSRVEAAVSFDPGSEPVAEPNAVDPAAKRGATGCYALMGLAGSSFRLATFSVEAVRFGDGSTWSTK